MYSWNKVIAIAAATTAVGFSTASHAVTLFQVDPNPSGTKLFLDLTKDATSSNGTVLTTDDVAISVTGASDFASGFATIKPVKGGSLTDLVFTPVNPNAFDDFSFRGQDILAGQVIDVIVQDNQGNAPQTLTFTQGKANQDFTREGIVAALKGETIKSVEIVNSGGFEEAKQFEFSTAPIPEPAVWAMMLMGFGGIGLAVRRRRRQITAAA